MVVIDRWESYTLNRRRGWLLIYGRRKVGKSFLLCRFMNWDVYVTITRSREAIIDGKKVEIGKAMDSVIGTLMEGRSAIVDEFQRLDETYWDILAQAHPNGRLILAGSSFGVVKKVFDSRSPLLGTVEPFKLGIISYWDVLANLKPKDRKEFLWAVLMRDPWIIPMISGNDPVEFLVERSFGLFMSAQGLIGEVFSEEERLLTALYDSILRLLGEGVGSARELAGILTSRGLLEGGTSAVTGILSKLEMMGLVTKVPLWRSGRGRYLYRHLSPLLSILYYMESKFGISDGYQPNEEAVRSILGREVQFSLGEMLAEESGARLAYHRSPEGDVDIILTDRRGRPLAGYEVKIGPISKGEAVKAIERMRRLGIPKTGLISLYEKPPDLGDRSMGPEDLVSLAMKIRAKRVGATD